MVGIRLPSAFLSAAVEARLTWERWGEPAAGAEERPRVAALRVPAFAFCLDALQSRLYDLC